MTKKIFRSIITVAMVVLVASLLLASTFLYDYFNRSQVSQLKEELSLVADNVDKVGTEYFDNLSKVDFNTENKVILINCAGKEGGDEKEVKNVLDKLKNMNNIFVDLRPQLDIEIVNIARQYGWDAYTGFGMNSRNDYVLLQKIQETTGINIPSFKEFAKLVANAS